MASTYSTSLRLELMATGDQSGTWGDTTNTNLGTLLEQAITGVLSVAQGDVANLTLTTVNGGSDQARNAVVNVTGALTAQRNVVVQTANKLYLIKNSTTGGFAIVAKTAAGTGVTIANGSSQWVYSDGTNVVQGLVGNGVPDTNGNLRANSFIPGYTTTATAAGTTTLTVASTQTQYFTGTTTQTITLPVVSTLAALGQGYDIVNLSTGALTVNSSGGNLVTTIPAGSSSRVEAILLTGTTAASWNAVAFSVPNPLTLSGSGAGYTPLALISTNTGTAVGPILNLFRDKTNATNDLLAQLLWNGRDGSGNLQEWASIQSSVVTATSGSEASTLDFYTQKGGARTLSASFAGPVATFTNAAQGYTTTATAAGTTTLTVSSTQQQYFTGTSTQTVVLPVTSTLTLGHSYRIVNNSTGGAVTVQSSGANNIVVLPQGSTVVVTCILTSGTTAASWDAKTAPNGGLVLLTSGTVSAAATLDIVLTSYTGYRGLIFKLINFIPATDGTSLNMRVSTNGGSSYDSGASDYMYAGYDGGSTVGPQYSAGAAQLQINPLLGNVSTEGATASIEIMGQTSTAVKPRFMWTSVSYTNSDTPRNMGMGGLRNATQDTDAVRFFMGSGNITSGDYAVYGYV